MYDDLDDMVYDKPVNDYKNKKKPPTGSSRVASVAKTNIKDNFEDDLMDLDDFDVGPKPVIKSKLPPLGTNKAANKSSSNKNKIMQHQDNDAFGSPGGGFGLDAGDDWGNSPDLPKITSQRNNASAAESYGLGLPNIH